MDIVITSHCSTYSVPVHSAIILPLIVYNDDPQVYVAACSAIYHIMSNIDCNGECCVMLEVCSATPTIAVGVLDELSERGVGSTLEGLREHRDDDTCLEWGCRALRTLIMDKCVHVYIIQYMMCVIMCHIVCNIVCHTVTVTYCMSHCVF